MTSNFEWQFRGCLLQHNLSYCVGISLQYEQERHEGWSACVLLLDLSVLFPLKSDLYVFAICFPISHVLMFFLQRRVDYVSVDDTREAALVQAAHC
jgi:hypothetical protein